MNFEHTEDRRMLADTLNRFITEQYPFEVRNQVAGSEQGLSTSVWQQLAEIGALGALFPEAVGGFGGAGFDVSVVFESLGRGLVVEPFLGALIVGRALAAAGSPAQQVALAGLIDGSTVAALAHDEPGNHYELSRVATRATATATGWQLDGARPWCCRPRPHSCCWSAPGCRAMSRRRTASRCSWCRPMRRVCICVAMAVSMAGGRPS